MSRFPEGWMAELLSRNDIASVVSDYLPLKSKGGRLWGLCPFHGEKTPSFSVTPDKQLYYCFGCHAGGSIIQFVMEMEKLGYGEAVRFLAERAKMSLPEEINDEALRRDRAHKERLYAVCSAAARFFHEVLASGEGEAGRSYFVRRGVSGKIVRRFGLGFAPGTWDALTTHLLSQGFSHKEICEAGLAHQKEQRVYDAFRARVMFPIFNASARVVGFGARAMGDEMPKYLNSAETPVFNKRQCIYGLSLMKGQKLDAMIVVEGYMDVVSLHAHGVTNAVATLGTALTAHQARLIKRYVSRVYIAYDGDAAGQSAMIRALGVLGGEGLQARVVMLPAGQDPDDLVRAKGKEGFDALVESALTASAFMLHCYRRKHDMATEDGREAYARESCAYIGGLEPLEQERYYAQVSRETGYPVSALQAQGRQSKRNSADYDENRLSTHRISVRRNTRDNVTENAGEIAPERALRERTLLLAMSVSREAAEAALAAGGAERFADGAYKRFASAMLARHDQGGSLTGETIAMLLGEMDARDAERIAAALEPEPLGDAEALAGDCLRWLEEYQLNEKIRTMQRSLEQETLTKDESRAVAKEIQQIRQQLHAMRMQSQTGRE